MAILGICTLAIWDQKATLRLRVLALFSQLLVVTVLLSLNITHTVVLGGDKYATTPIAALGPSPLVLPHIFIVVNTSSIVKVTFAVRPSLVVVDVLRSIVFGLRS